MKTYFSMGITCEVCGHTNREFPIREIRNKNGRIYLAKVRTCVECWREKKNKLTGRYRNSPKGVATRHAYLSKNRLRINEKTKIYNRVCRARKREVKRLLRMRELAFWKDGLK